MTTKQFLLFLYLGLTALSCTKENEDSSPYPMFEGITKIDGPEGMPISIDASDWRLDDEFSDVEQSLFDTLDFTYRAAASGMSFNNDVKVIPKFYPNPADDYGRFIFGDCDIVNLVIVDQAFNKKIEFRAEETILSFDFRSLTPGIYRMYYVFQNSDYAIKSLGHGDILIER